jgi:hypothetical protein
MRVVPTKTVIRKWGLIPITKVELAPEPGWTLETDRRYISWLTTQNRLQPPCPVWLCESCRATAHTTWENEMKNADGW